MSLQYRGPAFHRLEVWVRPELIARMDVVKTALEHKKYGMEFDDIVDAGLTKVLPQIKALVAGLPDNPLQEDRKESVKKRFRPVIPQ